MGELVGRDGGAGAPGSISLNRSGYFDQLYAEAGHRRGMMSISAHDRISGSPQMVRAWEEFLRYAQGCPGVAVMRKDEIARHALESSLTLREAEAI